MAAGWEIVVGLETHTQLLTQSKIFSGSSTAFGAAPNTQASAVDLALPGVLPVLNARAVEFAVRLGLAIGATISPRSVFARKNYFYPDLPKGYQISQYEQPVVQHGTLKIEVDGAEKTVRILRAHLEEDAGKSIHGEALSGVAGQGVAGLMRAGAPVRDEFRDLSKMSGIDLNRAGTALLEIVTEPDMRGAKEAIAYARALHSLVRWLGICDGNMQEGSFRCDANVSVRRHGEVLGTRCEIKNLNSFRFMEQAIEFEAARQIELIEDGGKVVQETRLYDSERNETRSMRSKEDAQDYRYFPDPDLLPLVITTEFVAKVKASLPELPDARRLRFLSDSYEAYSKQLREDISQAYKKVVYGLTDQDARALVASRELGDFFEACVAIAGLENAKAAANWIMGDVAASLNRDGVDISSSPVSAQALGGLLRRIADGTISGKIAKEVFDAMWRKEAVGPNAADAIIEAKGLRQISDSGAIEKMVDEVLAANARQVEDYRAGKEKAFNSLVGQVMKATKGKANPAQVNSILKKKLGG